MHYADKVFERLELKIRDDRLHEGIVRTKNLRKRYRKFFLSQEEREFRKKVQEYRKLDFQLYERWCATGRLPIIYQSDPRLGRIEEMRAEVERLGLGDMTVSRKREADEKAEFWSLAEPRSARTRKTEVGVRRSAASAAGSGDVAPQPTAFSANTTDQAGRVGHSKPSRAWGNAAYGSCRQDQAADRTKLRLPLSLCASIKLSGCC